MIVEWLGIKFAPSFHVTAVAIFSRIFFAVGLTNDVDESRYPKSSRGSRTKRFWRSLHRHHRRRRMRLWYVRIRCPQSFCHRFCTVKYYATYERYISSDDRDFNVRARHQLRIMYLYLRYISAAATAIYIKYMLARTFDARMILPL